jgi:hypothetical protein
MAAATRGAIRQLRNTSRDGLGQTNRPLTRPLSDYCMCPGGWMVRPIYLRTRRLCSTNKYRHGLKLPRL